jgi:hypothetical protein
MSIGQWTLDNATSYIMDVSDIYLLLTCLYNVYNYGFTYLTLQVADKSFVDISAIYPLQDDENIMTSCVSRSFTTNVCFLVEGLLSP